MTRKKKHLKEQRKKKKLSKTKALRKKIVKMEQDEGVKAIEKLLLEKAEEAGLVGLPIEEVLQIVREGKKRMKELEKRRQ